LNYARVCSDLFAMIGAGSALANLPSLDGCVRTDGAFIRIFNEEWCVCGEGVYDGERRLESLAVTLQYIQTRVTEES
jgi:hypothetical protein